MFTLAPLPYALGALAPYISAETLDYHYNKHHASYVAKLNSLLQNDTKLRSLSILEIIRKDPKSLPAGVYNSAAQAWNHEFYWKSLTPPISVAAATPVPSPRMNALITKSFGSYDAFKQKFSDVAAGHFGSGWAWLVQDKKTGLLKITETHDAVSAASDPSVIPVLTCDVWEHAYYIDYRNVRAKYIESWWKLVNWKFAESNVQFDLAPKL
ncbi:Fibronectin type III and SPRY domain-containing protein 1 [Blyttiomyces sp. JEL0837]|nr:Fibronectin type III and SPRY domain-containing protein 1 [Blyttiomyces sp. JEL0837]